MSKENPGETMYRIYKIKQGQEPKLIDMIVNHTFKAKLQRDFKDLSFVPIVPKKVTNEWK